MGQKIRFFENLTKFPPHIQFYLFIMMSFAMLTWGSAWASAKIINSYLDYNTDKPKIAIM